MRACSETEILFVAGSPGSIATEDEESTDEDDDGDKAEMAATAAALRRPIQPKRNEKARWVELCILSLMSRNTSVNRLRQTSYMYNLTRKCFPCTLST